MWAAIHDEGGSSACSSTFSRLHVQHPIKVWTETVERLWRLRQQHWQQTSKLRPHHQQHPHPQQHHPHPQPHHQHPRSHQHPHPHQISHPHPHLRPQPQPQLYPHPHLEPPHPHPQSQQQYPHYEYPHQHSHSHPDPYQGQHHRQHQQQHLQPSYITKSRWPLQGCFGSPLPCSTSPRLPRHSFSSPVKKVDRGFTGLQAHEACKPIRKQSPAVLCAKVTRLAATSTQQDDKDHEYVGAVQDQRRTTPSPSSGWKEEILPVPLGLVNETDAKTLNHLVNKRVESYIRELKQPASTVYKDYKHLKPSPIIHAGSLYHFKPSNLGQHDFEEWMKKHRRKKSSKSYCSSNVAFGRSISSRRRNSEVVATKAEAKNDSSFIKCMRGKLSEFEQEKKERQRKKAASQKHTAIQRKSRELSVVNTSQI